MEKYASICGVARFCWFFPQLCYQTNFTLVLRRTSSTLLSFCFNFAASGNSMDSLCHRNGELCNINNNRSAIQENTKDTDTLDSAFNYVIERGENYSRLERILISVKWQRHISDGVAYDESDLISDAGTVEEGEERGKWKSFTITARNESFMVHWRFNLFSFNKISNARHKANLKINFMFAVAQNAKI